MNTAQDMIYYPPRLPATNIRITYMLPDRKKHLKWLRDLANACLPIELQRKLLTLQPLTKEEAKRYINVLMLAAQARQLSQGEDTNDALDGIDRKIERVLSMSRQQLKNERAILWYVSSNDPKYQPDKGSKEDSIRRVMLQCAQSLISREPTLSERSAANIVIKQFEGVEGAYRPEDLETFRRQINRNNLFE